MSIEHLILDDHTLMYDNDVIIETVFVWFDSPKVDNAYQSDVKYRSISMTQNKSACIKLALKYHSQKTIK